MTADALYDARHIGAAASRDSVRRRIVAYCYVFYALIFLQGVLRKWVMTDWGDYLILICDPVLGLIYVEYLLLEKARALRQFGLWIALCFAYLMLALVQSLMLEKLDLLLVAIGFRYYLFYLPLVAVLPAVFTRADLQRFIKFNLYIAVPIAVLAVAQFYAPLTSPLNAGIGIDAFIFQVVAGVVRPYGPFSFAAAQAYYAALALCFVLIAWSGRDYFRISLPLLVVAGIAALSMGAVSGSRSYFLAAAVIAVVFVLSAFAARGAGSAGVTIASSAGLAVAFIVLFAVVFPEALETMTSRQQTAVASEGSTIGRVGFIFTEFISAIGDAPFFGYGVALGTNVGSYLVLGTRDFALAEYEWTRLTQELGPLFGLMVIGLRVLFFLWLGHLAIRGLLVRNQPFAVLMWAFAGPLVLVGSVTTQNTLLAFAWFTAGMVVALARLDARPSRAAAPPERAG